jgi:hypothetical protein
MEFNPERFLGENPEYDPRLTAFGYGRRICGSFHFVNSCHYKLIRCFYRPGAEPRTIIDMASLRQVIGGAQNRKIRR